MKNYKFTVAEEHFTAQIVEYTAERVVVNLNGTTYDVELIPEEITSPSISTTVHQVAPAPQSVQKSTPAPVVLSGRSVGAVTAPIPGVVKQIIVAVGDLVSEGSPVAILEAMKMENQIPATADGRVSKIAVNLGDSVLDGQLLIQIEAI